MVLEMQSKRYPTCNKNTSKMFRRCFTTYVSSEVLFEVFAVEFSVLVITDVELVDDGLTVAYALTKS